jgi:hypothetical protein
MNHEITPEMAIAIQHGVEKAIKDLPQFAETDPKDQVAPDQKLAGLVFNLTLEVDNLMLGHDTDKTPTCSIPMLPAMALLVRRMGVTREHALTLLKEVMQEALQVNTDKTAAELLLAETGVAEAQTQITQQVLSQLPRTLVRKAVRVSGCRVFVDGFARRAV